MLKNYLKITVRNIIKHKGYSFINIAGLAIGMACCLLIALWVLDELSYDKFHENAPNLYRVEENQHYSGRIYHVTVTPYPLGPALKAEIPEILDAARYVWAGGKLLRYEEKAFFENSVRAVDPSFLQMFTFPLQRGDKNTALESPFSLIISPEIAEKYFGKNNDPMGQVIQIDNQYEFTVTGVLEKLPSNSYVQFDILIPYAFLEKTGRANKSFGSNSISTFVLLPDSVAVEQANEKIFGFIRTKQPESRTDLELMPYTRMHLHEYFGFERDKGAIQYVYIFSIIAFFVLLIACINFMNLSTARSAKRAKEVGLRKVVGALKYHLVRQFYGESLVFAIIALIFAMLIVTLLLPVFGEFAGKELSWQVSGSGTLILGLVGIAIFTGLVAGSYPAMFLSAFQPVKVLKGSFKSGAGSARFRKILVVFQFTLSILLIIGTTGIYKQLNFMKDKRLGWDKEHFLYIPLRADMRKSYPALKAELAKDSRILGVSGSTHHPSHIGSNAGGAEWDGKDPDLQVLIGTSRVDFDYVETMGIEMAAGRSFSREFPSDLSKSFLINEETARIMGKESVVGERFSFMGVDGTIVGVMKDFHFQSVREKIDPLAILVAPERLNYMFIRISPVDISASVKFIESTWNRVIPNYPLDYRFVDEDFDRIYRTESRMGTLFKYFAVLAVFVACLGLFGLASFTAEQRTREIGIRKVLGASVPQITVLICREFFLLVLLANIIAAPVAYYLVNQWLQAYAYRTSLGWLIFASALFIAVIVALISVGFQALRAAIANPAESLKYE